MLAASLVALALAAPPALPAPGAPAASPPACGPAVAVSGGRWTGSGVVWDAGARRVVTALHVVEEMPPDGIVVRSSTGDWPARLVDSDPWLDVALLEVAGPVGEAPPLGSAGALRSGAPVELVRDGGRTCRSEAGRVLAASRALAGTRYLAVSAPVSPGASGGAVLDERGALVGLVDLALRREPGTALAIPIDRVAARFPRAAAPLTSSPALAAAPR